MLSRWKTSAPSQAGSRAAVLSARLAEDEAPLHRRLRTRELAAERKISHGTSAGRGTFQRQRASALLQAPAHLPVLRQYGRSRYFQARAIDAAIQPKELNLRGTVPFLSHNVSHPRREARLGVPLRRRRIRSRSSAGNGGHPRRQIVQKRMARAFQEQKCRHLPWTRTKWAAGTAVISKLFNAAGIKNARSERALP